MTCMNPVNTVRDNKTAFLNPRVYDKHPSSFLHYMGVPQNFQLVVRNLYASMRSEFQPQAVRVIASYSLKVFFFPSQMKTRQSNCA